MHFVGLAKKRPTHQIRLRHDKAITIKWPAIKNTRIDIGARRRRRMNELYRWPEIESLSVE